MRKAFVVPVLALVLGLCGLALPKAAAAQVAVGISVRIGPPALPVYEQPICPGPDYIWVPGYWAWDEDGDQYYWVPGTWVLAPEPGYLWTPGWWGYDEDGDDYVWHPGYWGPHVGFYGGINYGFGYFGTGYVGGEWRGDRFYYNRAVSRVNVTVVHNVYENRTVERNVYVNNHVSYNGGPRGVDARPTAEERRWDGERHVGPTENQQRHVDQARDDRSLHYNENHGRPPIGATPRPTQFPGNNRNQNEFRPPQNQNRGRENNYQQPNNRPERNYHQPEPNNRQENRNYNAPQPNNRPENRNYNQPQPNNRQENRNYNAPRNEGRPGGQPQAQPEQRGNRPEAQPRNEPHGNQGGGGGERGHGGGDHGDHGDHGRDNGGGR